MMKRQVEAFTGVEEEEGEYIILGKNILKPVKKICACGKD